MRPSNLTPAGTLTVNSTSTSLWLPWSLSLCERSLQPSASCWLGHTAQMTVTSPSCSTRISTLFGSLFFDRRTAETDASLEEVPVALMLPFTSWMRSVLPAAMAPVQ